MGPLRLNSAAGTFDAELTGDTLVVTPASELRELDFRRIEAGASDVLAFFDRSAARNVVVDLHRPESLGSSVLNFFVQLWQNARSCGGQAAVCNVSEHQREILGLTRLERMWPICASLQEALARFAGPGVAVAS
jgi:anti-anti-sigma factor